MSLFRDPAQRPEHKFPCIWFISDETIPNELVRPVSKVRNNSRTCLFAGDCQLMAQAHLRRSSDSVWEDRAGREDFRIPQETLPCRFRRSRDYWRCLARVRPWLSACRRKVCWIPTFPWSPTFSRFSSHSTQPLSVNLGELSRTELSIIPRFAKSISFSRLKAFGGVQTLIYILFVMVIRSASVRSTTRSRILSGNFPARPFFSFRNLNMPGSETPLAACHRKTLKSGGITPVPYADKLEKGYEDYWVWVAPEHAEKVKIPTEAQLATNVPKNSTAHSYDLLPFRSLLISAAISSIFPSAGLKGGGEDSHNR